MGAGLPRATSLHTEVIQSDCAVRDRGDNDLNITCIEKVIADLHFG